MHSRIMMSIKIYVSIKNDAFTNYDVLKIYDAIKNDAFTNYDVDKNLCVDKVDDR